MRKVCVFLLLAALLLAMPVYSVLAQDPYPRFAPGTTIADGAGKLDPIQQQAVASAQAALIARFPDKHPKPIALTTTDTLGKSAIDYVNGFLENRTFEENGVQKPYRENGITSSGVLVIFVDYGSRNLYIMGGDLWGQIIDTKKSDSIIEDFIKPSLVDDPGAAFSAGFKAMADALDLQLNPPPTSVPQPTVVVQNIKTTNVNTEGLGKGLVTVVLWILGVAAFAGLLYLVFGILLPIVKTRNKILEKLAPYRTGDSSTNVALLSKFPSDPAGSVIMQQIMLVLEGDKPTEAQKHVTTYHQLRDRVLRVQEKTESMKLLPANVFVPADKLEDLLAGYKANDKERTLIELGYAALQTVAATCKQAAEEAPKLIADAHAALNETKPS